MVRCAIYARKSLAEGDTENQLHALRNYAAAQKWEVVAELEEQRHGNRPGEAAYNELQKLIAHRKIDVVLVWALDRLQRPDVGDLGGLLSQLAQWRARGVEWYSLSEPFLSTSGAQGAVAELLLAIFGWVAGFERRRISERTRAALAQRRALGVRLGRPPRGAPAGTGSGRAQAGKTPPPATPKEKRG